VVIGASLGGISSLLALGERSDVFAGLVMVDITPMMRQEGLDGIHNFMQAKSREGFASAEEASEAIAAYLPHRPRPKSLDGLKKNLRLRADGRYYWHWDPRFSEGARSVNFDRAVQIGRMREAARGLKVPVILVRGRSSELVGDEEAADFQALCPQAEYADIAGARHMVAGDKNDIFARKVLDFMTRHFK
jgi:pimeloyl-ACP methyl ester carboxylesterase